MFASLASMDPRQSPDGPREKRPLPPFREVRELPLVADVMQPPDAAVTPNPATHAIWAVSKAVL